MKKGFVLILMAVFFIPSICHGDEFSFQIEDAFEGHDATFSLVPFTFSKHFTGDRGNPYNEEHWDSIGAEIVFKKEKSDLLWGGLAHYMGTDSYEEKAYWFGGTVGWRLWDEYVNIDLMGAVVYISKYFSHPKIDDRYEGIGVAPYLSIAWDFEERHLGLTGIGINTTYFPFGDDVWTVMVKFSILEFSF